MRVIRGTLVWSALWLPAVFSGGCASTTPSDGWAEVEPFSPERFPVLAVAVADLLGPGARLERSARSSIAEKVEARLRRKGYDIVARDDALERLEEELASCYSSFTTDQIENVRAGRMQNPDALVIVSVLQYRTETVSYMGEDAGGRPARQTRKETVADVVACLIELDEGIKLWEARQSDRAETHGKIEEAGVLDDVAADVIGACPPRGFFGDRIHL